MISRAAEGLIADILKILDVPDSSYEAAERSYKSLGAWLDRPASTLSGLNAKVYTQGSFRLGTPIRPADDEEHYDLDVVCELVLPKHSITQEQLHSMLGVEVISYARAQNMQAPTPWRRCWTLNYADSAQFHMDILPSIPDAQRQRKILEERKLSSAFVETSVAITDSAHPAYRTLSYDWPVSNPNGFAAWFHERMKATFDKQRDALRIMEKKASVSDIPSFRVRTPLQAAIQVLKRHRDMQFSESPDEKPTSIILTTLAAHAYAQEASVSEALLSILARMENAIYQDSRGMYWIANPSDARENFADAWNEQERKRAAFYEWLAAARADFKAASESSDVSEIVDALSPRLGRSVVEKAANIRNASSPASSASLIKRASTSYGVSSMHHIESQ